MVFQSYALFPHMSVIESTVLVLASSTVKFTVFSLPLVNEKVGERGSDYLAVKDKELVLREHFIENLI